MRGVEDELLEAEPELEATDSDDDLEPEPELLPDSDSEDEPEPEPELLPDGDQPRTIFDQSDEDWIATAERGIGAHHTRKPRDSTSSSMQWWREKARSDIAARLKSGVGPLHIERTGGEEVRDQTDENGTPVGASNAWQPTAPAGEPDGSASDGEASTSDGKASTSDSSASEEWEVQEQPGLQQREHDQLSDDEIEMNEEAAQAERERELQEMRSEFSDLQDLVKRMRSPVESSAGSTSGQRQRTRSVQEIESQIEASVDLSLPARSPAGKDAEVAGWLVTRRLARAEELIGKLEGVTVDDTSADIVASPFKVEHSSAAVDASSGTGTATPRTGTGSRRRPRRTPGSTQSSRTEKRDDSERRRDSGTTSKMADRAGSQRRGNGRSEKARDKPSALTPRSQPNPTSSTPTRRRSAQRPGARASGRDLSHGKRNVVNGTNRETRASSSVGSHDSRGKSRNRS